MLGLSQWDDVKEARQLRIPETDAREVKSGLLLS
jgi:hypothetical protein